MKEKAAYLKGLIDGLGIDENTKEGKVIKAMSELLSEMAETVDSIDEDVTHAYDQINDLSEELEDLEADLYEDEDAEDEEDDSDDETEADDDDDNADVAGEPYYEVACPACGKTVYVSEDDLDAGEANCAHCGVTFEVALEGDEEEPDEDAPVQYEVTCPDCGKRLYPFGEGRTADVAKQYGLPMLAQLPIQPELAKKCDEGRLMDIQLPEMGKAVDAVLKCKVRKHE